MMCMRKGHRSQARVLVADWDRHNALSLTSIMHRAGFKTTVALNGKDAVQKAETFRPDLLVTEAYLGRLSGIHAAARITAALPDCKVLFLSMEASDADIARGAPEGLIYSHISKPIHPLDLLNAISYLLSAEWCASDSAMTDHNPPNTGAAGAARAAGETAKATGKQVADAILYRNSRVAASFESDQDRRSLMVASTGVLQLRDTVTREF